MLVCSQTPLVRFLGDGWAGQEFVDVSRLVEGVDFIFSPGGVTRMVYPLIMRLVENDVLDEGHWLSLNTNGPRQAILGPVRLYFVKLGAEALRGYGAAKEEMWKLLHGVQDERPLSLLELAWTDEYAYYNLYNRVCSETALALDRELDFDLFYIHDFQQLPMGEMMGTLKPKLFRWHIPFNEEAIPPEWSGFLGRYLNAYDAVVVSSKSYMETLLKRGYVGRAFYVYPYIDTSQYGTPTKSDLQQFADKHGLGEDDGVISIVARLDPLKGHDRALKALAKVVKTHNVKLLIVGNGSFSSSKKGLGLSKGEAWRTYLQTLVKNLGLEKHVIFTGHVSQKELECVYTLSDFTVLPSVAEGFGLVVVESWLFGKPVVVSKAAGIAELIVDGVNGYLVGPDDVSGLADRMRTLLENPSLTEEMGKNGRETAKLCSLERSLEEEKRIIEEVVG